MTTEEIIERHHMVAEQGDAVAQHALGKAYQEGRGVAKNDVKAASWYQKAAEQGLAIAQYELGVAYHKGRGVVKNEEEALSWYRKAAVQNNFNAQFSIMEYEHVKSCHAAADMVAKNGDAMAQYALGNAYKESRGVEGNYVEALRRYDKAVVQGLAGAQYELGVACRAGYSRDTGDD